MIVNMWGIDLSDCQFLDYDGDEDEDDDDDYYYDATRLLGMHS